MFDHRHHTRICTNRNFLAFATTATSLTLLIIAVSNVPCHAFHANNPRIQIPSYTRTTTNNGIRPSASSKLYVDLFGTQEQAAREGNNIKKERGTSSDKGLLYNFRNNGVVAAALFMSILSSPLTLNTDTIVNHPNNIIESNNILTKSQALAAPMNENQQFVSDVWSVVTAQFFDPTFNSLTERGWREQKRIAVASVADTGPDEEDRKIVEEAIGKMLGSLGDPYTRFLNGEKYETLTAYAKGESAGIGVQLLLDPRASYGEASMSSSRNGAVVVANVSGDGPAEKAGMQQGDVILEIDGESMEGATAELVAAKCRGQAGTTVDIILKSPNPENNNFETKKVTITRSNIQVNPVRTSTFQSSTNADRKVGLITIPAFSQETPTQVLSSIRTLRNEQHASILVIDLRGNVGGYMPAGIDTSKLFLQGGRRIVSEVNRADQATAYYADGIGAETSVPLYVLVDSRTASAAEIFGAALQDNRRAVLVGVLNEKESAKTFGKGRIQNVQSVGNGSGVAVTRARYVTPSGKDLHGVGITPDKVTDCKREDSASLCLKNIV